MSGYILFFSNILSCLLVYQCITTARRTLSICFHALDNHVIRLQLHCYHVFHLWHVCSTLLRKNMRSHSSERAVCHLILEMILMQILNFVIDPFHFGFAIWSWELPFVYSCGVLDFLHELVQIGWVQFSCTTLYSSLSSSLIKRYVPIRSNYFLFMLENSPCQVLRLSNLYNSCTDLQQLVYWIVIQLTLGSLGH